MHADEAMSEPGTIIIQNPSARERCGGGHKELRTCKQFDYCYVDPNGLLHDMGAVTRLIDSARISYEKVKNFYRVVPVTWQADVTQYWPWPDYLWRERVSEDGELLDSPPPLTDSIEPNEIEEMLLKSGLVPIDADEYEMVETIKEQWKDRWMQEYMHRRNICNHRAAVIWMPADKNFPRPTIRQYFDICGIPKIDPFAEWEEE
jgi:hypothetical protein